MVLLHTMNNKTLHFLILQMMQRIISCEAVELFL